MMVVPFGSVSRHSFRMATTRSRRAVSSLSACRLRHCLLACLVAVGECACAPTPDINAEFDPGAQSTVGVLLVGDAGYHLHYVENDYDDPVTADEFFDGYRKRLTAVGAPDPEAELPPSRTFAGSGHTVPASGLHPVTAAMDEFCSRQADCDFGFLLGDNIYPRGATEGSDGHADDERFTDIFVVPYEALFSAHPGFQFDVVLGNHDWYTSVGGAVSQRTFHETHPNYFMNGFFYRRRHETQIGTVDVFAIDTQLLLSTVVVPRPELDESGTPEDYAEIQVLDPWVTEYAMTQADQVAWLEAQLMASDALWKIVIGHHPLWSSSGEKFQQAQALRRLLLPVLCASADVYIAGHDHTLEIHEQSCAGYADDDLPPLTHVVSGAASKQRPVNYMFARHQAETMPGFKPIWARGMIWGFGHLDMSRDEAVVTLVTTPDDGTGSADVVYQHRFPRRSARQYGD